MITKQAGMDGCILVIDDFDHCLMAGLQEAGYNVLYRPEIPANEVKDALLACKPFGLLVRSKIQVDAEILSTNFGWLKWIGRGGAGMDNIDEAKALALGIHCFNAGEANSIAVGEQTIGMMLSLLHRVGKGNLEVRKGIWDREGNRGVELASLTVGIIGLGNTGGAVANRLCAFGCKILAYDKYKVGYGKALPEIAESKFLEGGMDISGEANRALDSGVIYEANLDEIYRQADIISLHVPLTDETYNWMDINRLWLFRKPIWLLNLSRGKVVNLEAVVEGIAAGRILGFGADVLEKEPPFENLNTFEILRKNDAVIFTPHVGGWTVESYRRISEVLLEKILKLKI